MPCLDGPQFFMQPPTEGQLSCSQVLMAENKAAEDMRVQASEWIEFPPPLGKSQGARLLGRVVRAPFHTHRTGRGRAETLPF